MCQNHSSPPLTALLTVGEIIGLAVGIVIVIILITVIITLLLCAHMKEGELIMHYSETCLYSVVLEKQS